MDCVAKVVSGVSVGKPIECEGLQAFPLFSGPSPRVKAIPLDEALERGVFKVKEVSAGGSVPTLRVENSAPDQVLLLAGEQLVGAKQNRILNTSVLVEGESTQTVSVSCVEQGRWSYVAPGLRSAGSASHAALRRKLCGDVSQSYKARKRPDSDQREVWAEVQRKLRQVGSNSSTGALEQAYADNGQRLEQLVAAVSLPRRARGVAFAVGGRLVGLDLFNRPQLLRGAFSKLAKASALDALGDHTPLRLSRAGVEGWLQSVLEARCESYPGQGLGQDVRIETPEGLGSALVVDDALVHLQLFPSQVVEAHTLALVPTDAWVATAASRAILALAGPIGELGVHLALTAQREVPKGDVLSRAAERALVATARVARPEAGLRLAVTRRALGDGWFSHRHDDTVVVSTAGVEALSGRPRRTFVAYELLVHALNLAAPALELTTLLHEETKGCLFDLCRRRSDLERKLHEGKLCRPCARALTRGGVEPSPVRAALRAMVAL